MGKKKTGRQDLLPGTLDMLILKSLSIGVMHGYGIAQHIRSVSGEVLHVEEGSLYPAVQRLQIQGSTRSGDTPPTTAGPATTASRARDAARWATPNRASTG
jgi:DNA-binding PadR family transcriptional regulator